MAKSKAAKKPTGEERRQELRKFVADLEFDAPVKEINAMITTALRETDAEAWLFEQISTRQNDKPAETKADPPAADTPPAETKEDPPAADTAPPEQPAAETKEDPPADNPTDTPAAETKEDPPAEKPLIQQLADLADSLGFAGDAVDRGNLIDAALKSPDPHDFVRRMIERDAAAAARPSGIQIPEAARELQGLPPTPAAPTPEPTPPAGALSQVTITVPLAPPLSKDELEKVYIRRHVDLQLDGAQTVTFRRLTDGLDQSGARLAADGEAAGRRVQTGADAIRWLLDALAGTAPPLEG